MQINENIKSIEDTFWTKLIEWFNVAVKHAKHPRLRGS